MTKVKIISLYIIAVILLSIIMVIISSLEFVRSDFVCISSFILNGIIWFILLMLELRNHAYSLKIIHWTFCIFFYFIAAFVQYGKNSFPWIEYRSDDTVFTANMYLLLWTFSFLIGTKIRIKGENTVSKYLVEDYVLSERKIIIMTALNFLILLWRIVQVGFSGLLKKSAIVEGISYGSDSSSSLLIDKVLVSFCCFSTLISIFMSTKHTYKKYALLNVICLILSYFPTNISRNVAAAVYGSLLIVSFNKLKRNRVFIVGFIFSFLIIFPFMDNFRYNDIGTVDIGSSLLRAVKNIPTVWTQGHYDAYTTFTMTLDKVENSGISWGYQLIGVLLFFVPRSIWPSKPVGSGSYMAKELGIFPNISCSLPGEAYINFGIIGIILFGIIFGAVSGFMDSLYWDEEKISLRLETLYPVVMLMFFFMCRGDLLSSFAYTVAFIATWFVMTKEWSLSSMGRKSLFKMRS